MLKCFQNILYIIIRKIGISSFYSFNDQISFNILKCGINDYTLWGILYIKQNNLHFTYLGRNISRNAGYIIHRWKKMTRKSFTLFAFSLYYYTCQLRWHASIFPSNIEYTFYLKVS